MKKLNTTLSPAEAVKKAVDYLGGYNATARLFNIGPPSVFRWVQRGLCPPDRCLDLERMTGGQVTRYELRPDIYGPAPKKRARRKS